MTWFKVDDKFHTSEEVMSIPMANRAAAIGLWTLAGAWTSDHLKNGYVPATHLENWGGSKELAALLVDAKLWVRVGRTGFQFRNWDKWQITREQVEANRDREREKKAEWRAAKAAKQGRGPGNVPGDTTVRPQSVPRDKVVRPRVVPSIPTRPDPTRPDLLTQEIGEGRVSTTGPFCPRHPNGTEEPCGPCRTARLAFEARKDEKPRAPRTKRPRPGDGHDHKPDEHGYCPICGERASEETK